MTTASADLGVTRCGNTEFRWGQRTYVMGIVNVTPDSFSGDGLGDNVEAAVEQAKRFAADGADIIDVGGESTRPTSTPVSADEDLRRVLPVIERLVAEVPLPISIDTYKSEVARRAVAAGAAMLNDVWGLKHDRALARVAAEHNLPLVLMHNQHGTQYRDLIPDMLDSLRHSIDLAVKAGVSWQNIIVDPGIGLGKDLEQNLEVMRRLG